MARKETALKLCKEIRRLHDPTNAEYVSLLNDPERTRALLWTLVLQVERDDREWKTKVKRQKAKQKERDKRIPVEDRKPIPDAADEPIQGMANHTCVTSDCCTREERQANQRAHKLAESKLEERRRTGNYYFGTPKELPLHKGGK